MYNGKTATCITITKLWIFVAMKLLESRIFIVCCQLSPRTTAARDVRTQTFWRPRPRLSNDRRPRRRRRRRCPVLLARSQHSNLFSCNTAKQTLANTTQHYSHFGEIHFILSCTVARYGDVNFVQLFCPTLYKCTHWLPDFNKLQSFWTNFSGL